MKKFIIYSKKYGKKEVLLDLEDWDKIKEYRWNVIKNHNTDIFYATTNIKIGGKWKMVQMHRFIMNAPKGKIIDHFDKNSLNNQKKNLRICTYIENNRNARLRKDNKTGYRGVHYCKKSKKYKAQLSLIGRKIYLGLFISPEKAYEAYCKAKEKYL